MHSTTSPSEVPPLEWGPQWFIAWLNQRPTNGNGHEGPHPNAEPSPAPEPSEVHPSQPQPPQPGEHEAEPLPCPQPLKPEDIIPPEALDEARAHLALGDRKEYNRRMETLFVQGLKTLLLCEGDQAISQVLADFAYLMDLSTETIKRYLKKHASRWGPFEMLGEVVRLREAGHVD